MSLCKMVGFLMVKLDRPAFSEGSFSVDLVVYVGIPKKKKKENNVYIPYVPTTNWAYLLFT